MAVNLINTASTFIDPVTDVAFQSVITVFALYIFFAVSLICVLFWWLLIIFVKVSAYVTKKYYSKYL